MFKSLFYIVVGVIGAAAFNGIYQTNALGFNSLIQHSVKNALLALPTVEAATNPQTITVDSLNGLVTQVSDGDTLTVRTSYGDIVVRLFAIDAPEASCHGFSDDGDAVCTESGQTGARDSKLYLRQLVLKKNVDVKLGQGVSHNRVVGTVYADGQDVNLKMVNAGQAWHYKFYSKNQSSDDRRAYKDAEINAQSLKSGLWADNNPVPPWNWRKQHKAPAF